MRVICVNRVGSMRALKAVAALHREREDGFSQARQPFVSGWEIER